MDAAALVGQLTSAFPRSRDKYLIGLGRLLKQLCGQCGDVGPAAWHHESSSTFLDAAHFTFSLEAAV